MNCVLFCGENLFSLFSYLAAKPLVIEKLEYLYIEIFSFNGRIQAASANL